jgi:hypothetical protein
MWPKLIKYIIGLQYVCTYIDIWENMPFVIYIT